MANNFKRRSLKGVVLIMVVTVMLMLIILLLATMAVVSTAQNRYYTKFEENQAYYTARSALDVYITNLFSDKAYLAYKDDGITVRQYSYTDSGGTPHHVDMKQGLAMQLDTYRIKAHSDTIEHYNAMADKTQFSTDYWANAKGVFDSGTPEYTYYDGTNGPDLPFIEYEVELPEVKDGSNAYGGIVDTDSSNKQIAKIRVEVLARTYAGHVDGATDITADKKAIKDGERHKDQVYIKVTSNVEYQNIDGMASVVLYPPEMSESMFTSALTATGSLQNPDNALIIDGFAVPDPASGGEAEVKFPNDGVFVGKSFTGGAMKDDSGKANFPLSKGECIYIAGVKGSQNGFYPTSLGGISDEKEVPIFYSNGDVTFNKKVNWGGKSGASLNERVDLVVKGDMTHLENEFDFNGNIYVKGNCVFNGTSLKLNNSCKIFVDGDIEVGSNASNGFINTDVYCSGDVTLSTGVTEFPKLHVLTTATVTINGNSFDVMSNADPFDPIPGVLVDGLGHNQGKIGLITSFDGMTYLDVSTLTTTDAGYEISLPTVNGSSVKAGDYKRTVPSEQSEYCNYWRVDSSTGTVQVGTYVSAEEMAGTTSKAKRDIGDYTEKDFTPTPEAQQPGHVFSGMDETRTITVSSEEDYLIKNTCSKKNITFDGSGTINVYVEAGASVGGSGSCVFIIGDDVKANFYFPKGNYFWNCSVISASVKTAMDNHELCFGSEAVAKPCLPSPKIKYYISEDSVINTQDGSGTFVGYVYAPEAEINLSGGWNGCTINNYYYNDQVVTKVDESWTPSVMTNRAAIIGAIVCKKYTTANNPAICYIKDEESSVSPGDPFWDTPDRYYYTRN